ncbi:keratin-associated protein 5-5-like [Diaphorina citri]|uniref:Keratin-associated protein 5-5-like n=1 Tax=Diaphorina citri TaxID=121845 RepID=A0A3Q0IWN1_DIACI|nr:keratin-associated protein 5-5-like [Diaphorina citri]XP_026679074.1 keratin-associated protein 5-5-like [Diaphorina citri]
MNLHHVHLIGILLPLLGNFADAFPCKAVVSGCGGCGGGCGGHGGCGFCGGLGCSRCGGRPGCGLCGGVGCGSCRGGCHFCGGVGCSFCSHGGSGCSSCGGSHYGKSYPYTSSTTYTPTIKTYTPEPIKTYSSGLDSVTVNVINPPTSSCDTKTYVAPCETAKTYVAPCETAKTYVSPPVSVTPPLVPYTTSTSTYITPPSCSQCGSVSSCGCSG